MAIGSAWRTRMTSSGARDEVTPGSLPTSTGTIGPLVRPVTADRMERDDVASGPDRAARAAPGCLWILRARLYPRGVDAAPVERGAIGDCRSGSTSGDGAARGPDLVRREPRLGQPDGCRCWREPRGDAGRVGAVRAVPTRRRGARQPRRLLRAGRRHAGVRADHARAA